MQLGNHKITAIILGILLAGTGHLYLGIRRRGLIFLLLGIAVITYYVLSIGSPASWLASILNLVVWVTSLADLIRILQKSKDAGPFYQRPASE